MNAMNDSRIELALERAMELGEVGLQVAAYLNGELIVDECIGIVDEATAEPVVPTTLFPVFSVTKAVVATAVQLVAERGLVEVDAPIARYWPEYRAAGKGNITIRHVLTHWAGVPQVPADLTPDRLSDWDAIVEHLARVEPLAEPGERYVYHTFSFGYLLAEVIRRVDSQHRMFGDFVRDELCEPLGIDDLWIGLPAQEEHRVAPLTLGRDAPHSSSLPANPHMDLSLMELTSPAAITPDPSVYNLPAVHQACLPAAGGIMSARACAKFFSLLAGGGEVDGIRLLDRDRLLALTEPRPKPHTRDEVFDVVTWLGVGGYWLGGEHPPASPVVGEGKHILAHGGAGGSIGWADLDTGLAAAITHNRMFSSALDRSHHPFVAIGSAIRDIAGS